jgi:hypothetical protein
LHNDDELGAIDPIHFINLVNCAAQQPYSFDDIKMLINKGKGYLTDSAGFKPSHYISENFNMVVLSELFNLMADNELEFDKDMIFYGFRNN